MTDTDATVDLTAGPDDRERHNTPGPTFQELLDGDRFPVPPILRERAPWNPDLPTEIPKSIYLDQDVHDREVRGLWLKTWQVVGRLEHFREVGDSLLYEIADREYIVVRNDPDTIKAFPNSCLHRGRQLRDGGGPIRSLRCPFHGFTWNLDGSLKSIPTKWDFCHVEDDLHLPEAQVDTWGGFVFINPDPGAEGLDSFLDGFERHFERFDTTDWYTRVHAAKVLDCNWKLLVEAFIEASHVSATHPQSLPGTDPCNSQQDIWRNYVRILTPTGMPSGLLPMAGEGPTEQQKLDAMMGRTSATSVVQVAEGTTARLMYADIMRGRLQRAGMDTDYCDSEMVDLQTFCVFPNFLVLGGARGLWGRFRPYGSDPNKSIMELAILNPPKKDGSTRPAPTIQWLEEDQVWSDLPELADYHLFDQDLRNLSRMQQGLRNNRERPVLLSRYQEAPLGHFYDYLSRTWLADAE